MWRLSGLPIHRLDHFKNNGWLADGSVDWIDQAFPSDIETLFGTNSSKDDEDGAMAEVEEDDRELTDIEEEED